jgi:hypothetical protein
LAPWQARTVGLLAAILVRTRDRNRAEGLIQQMNSGPMPHGVPLAMFGYHLICKETEAATEWFEKAIDQHDTAAVTLNRSPFMKPLRDSPRWPALAKMMNLPGT